MRIGGQKGTKMFVNGHYVAMSPQQVLNGANVYGGAVQSQTETYAIVWFDSIPSAASWADTYDIEENVHLVWHPRHFGEELTVRYVFDKKDM